MSARNPSTSVVAPRALHVGPRLSTDAVSLLRVWVVFLVLIPANLVVSALGAAGSPAQIIGLAAAMWWFAVQLDKTQATVTPGQPIRRAMLVFIAAILASYIVATSRPIEGPEMSAADRGVLLAFSWLGILLITSDGIPSRASFDRLLQLVCLTTGIAGVLGLLQFFTHQQFVDLIQIPGLSPHQALFSVYARNGFPRAAGTSTHPIEFGVLLAMILPLALHSAVTDSQLSALRRWFPVAAISAALPITMSRSALLGLAVVLAVVLPTWPAPRRRWAYASVAVGLLAVYVAVPGLLGTMGRLFTGISSDDSAQSRVDSYDLAWHFISLDPVFGRGVSTFLPAYRILDNQYLGLLIETGLVGLGAFIALLVTGLVMGVRIRRSTDADADRGLATALLATLASATLACATFDAFGFPQVASFLFFILGCLTALARLVGLTPGGVRHPHQAHPSQATA